MKHLPSPPTPPLAPKHLKIFTCCCLEYSITNSQGTLGEGLGVRRKKEKVSNRTTAWDSKQKGTEESQKYSKRADPPGAGTPHVELTVSHSSQL